MFILTSKDFAHSTDDVACAEILSKKKTPEKETQRDLIKQFMVHGTSSIHTVTASQTGVKHKTIPFAALESRMTARKKLTNREGGSIRCTTHGTMFAIFPFTPNLFCHHGDSNPSVQLSAEFFPASSNLGSWLQRQSSTLTIKSSSLPHRLMSSTHHIITCKSPCTHVSKPHQGRS